MWVFGQDLLVVGELAVDEPAHEVHALEVEQDLVAAGRQDDIHRLVDVGEDPGQLGERPGGDDEARLLDRVEGRQRLDRDPVVVGRGQGDPVALESPQDAGEDRSGLVARRGEGGHRQRLAEDDAATRGWSVARRRSGSPGILRHRCP